MHVNHRTTHTLKPVRYRVSWPSIKPGYSRGKGIQTGLQVPSECEPKSRFCPKTCLPTAASHPSQMSALFTGNTGTHDSNCNRFCHPSSFSKVWVLAASPPSCTAAKADEILGLLGLDKRVSEMTAGASITKGTRGFMDEQRGTQCLYIPTLPPVLFPGQKAAVLKELTLPGTNESPVSQKVRGWS